MEDETRTLLESALRKLLAEIAEGDYRDRLKHRLTKHAAYQEALAVVSLSQVLGPEQQA